MTIDYGTEKWCWREAIKQRIELLGYSEKHVAKESGIDQANLNKFIRGKQNMSSARLEGVCDFLGLELVATDSHSLAMRVTRLERIVHRYENGPPHPSQLKRRGRPSLSRMNANDQDDTSGAADGEHSSRYDDLNVG